jgi:hypothetical protein
LETLTINGVDYKVEKIGNGAWTTAYKYGENEVIAKVHKADFTKAIALGFPKNRHLPKLEFMWTDEEGRYSYYKMPYYDRVSYGHQYYNKVDKIVDNINGAWNKSMRHHGYSVTRESVDEFYDNVQKKVSKGLFDALVTVIESIAYIMDFGSDDDYDFRLDLGIRNVAVDEKGVFILLDPMVLYSRSLHGT